MLGLLCDDLLPILGSERVPNEVLLKVGDMLSKASVLWRYPSEVEKDVRGAEGGMTGTTAPCIASPKEDYRYWCLGVLFDAVDGSSQEQGEEPIDLLMYTVMMG
jgi:hypothetical protein